MKRFYILKRLLLDLFYPNRCGMCGREIYFDEYFCNTCVKLFSPPSENLPIPYVDYFIAFSVYDVFGKIFRVEEESVTVFDGNVSIKGMT